MTDPLFDALDRVVPDFAEERGDWEAVLDGALRAPPDVGTKRRRRPLSRRQFAAVVFAAACIAVVSATPAFGLRSLILDLVHGKTTVSFVKSRPAPAEIKKQFLDLAQGAPPGMNPHPLPREAREVDFRGAGGRKRVLWIAPTESGGYCSFVVGASGGCITKASERHVGAFSVGGSFSERRGGPIRMTEVDGQVYSPRVATLTLEFQDHDSQELPFVYVSAPIGAGFYIAGVASDHQEAGHGPAEVVARDAKGVVVATRKIRIPPARPSDFPPHAFTRQPAQAFPLAGSVHPAAPTQTGSADGVTVVAGANDAVQLTARDVPPTIARFLRQRVSIVCFRITHEFGIFDTRGTNLDGLFAESIGLTFRGVGHPFDGCEIDNERGHRWPDQLGSHSPVEIPLTPVGRAYFEDRAAARDLALFVRSGRMQRIRKEPGTQLLRDMRAAYGPALAKSSIRYRLTSDGITFTERSSSGKLFTVVVAHGRVVHSNLEPYASVH